MSEAINVLSLFDGISGCQLALKELGIPVKQYLSCEIDKNAIAVTNYQFPNTFQLGDVRELDPHSLPTIDLLTAGFPCQAFSLEGQQKGFEDQRGQLFFEVVRLLKALQPTYFLCENVKMKKEYRDLITRELGVEPVFINSSEFSAQNRPRNYWTNIPPFPHSSSDRAINFSSILEDNPTDFTSPRPTDITRWKLDQFSDQRSVSFVETRTEEAKQIRRESRSKGRDYKPRRMKELVPRKDDKANCLTTGLSKNQIVIDRQGRFRYLTPLECERLQTLPDDYTRWGISQGKILEMSRTQRYKMIGNGWNNETIKYLLHSLV